MTGYLEKQLGLLTLRLNNWGPGTGLDIRHEDLSMTLLAEQTKNKSKDLAQYVYVQSTLSVFLCLCVCVSVCQCVCVSVSVGDLACVRKLVNKS